MQKEESKEQPSHEQHSKCLNILHPLKNTYIFLSLARGDDFKEN